MIDQNLMNTFKIVERSKTHKSGEYSQPRYIKAVLEDENVSIIKYRDIDGQFYYSIISESGKHSYAKFKTADPISCLAQLHMPEDEKVALAQRIIL
jgi:hypothetical protein